LFIHFFRLVKEMSPSFFVVENVPGIMNAKFTAIREEAYSLIAGKYKKLPPMVINTLDYGLPTSRSRVIFIGYKKGKVDRLEAKVFKPSGGVKPHYVQDALEGLPVQLDCFEHPKNGSKYWCKIDKPTPGSYADMISVSCPEAGNEEAVFRYFEHSEVTGMIGTKHSPEVIRRYESIPPGGKDFISKSYRLQMDGFCPTLRAGTDREHGSFQAVRPLHPIEARVITPREAARLQGFPDWFLFHNTKWHSFRQIGNSVSPILAEYILRSIREKLK
jgi:DNA (cytosine-5)-methyltransferase 1